VKVLRTLVALALVWCALVEVAEFVAGRLFGMELDGDWFLMLAASDAAELANFGRTYAVQLTVGITTFFCLAVVLAAAAFKLKLKALFLMLAVYAGIGIWHSGTWRAWKPLYVAYDTVRGTAGYRALIAAGSWTPERAAAVRQAGANATNYVFVIGESLTSDRMPLYGYAKPTMPELEKRRDELAVLGPLRAPSPYTARSLTAMLVRDGETAAVAFRKAGYRTSLVSAQGHWERYCGIEQMIFAACETRRYLDGDGALPSVVREEIAKADGRPFVCFVHMYGSHFEPGSTLPKDFAANEGLDGYDRSVRYADKVLGELIANLPPRTVLVLTSDHGESVDCAGWRDVRSESLWRVPLVIWPKAAAGRVAAVRGFAELWYNFL